MAERRRDAGAPMYDAAALRLYIGTTSGHAYSWWQGNSYPSGLLGGDMRGYQAQELGAIEVRTTLYRMPAAETLSRWAAQVPDDFRFALVAPSRITHLNRLVGVEDVTRYFLGAVKALGRRGGPVLFQFPASFPKDEARLVQFLQLLPADVTAAFEFRHPSWHRAAIYKQLERRNYAFSVTDSDAAEPSPFAATADWGYVRLRRAAYDDAALAEWLDSIRAPGWRAAYVFFENEDEARAGQLAQRLRQLAGGFSAAE